MFKRLEIRVMRIIEKKKKKLLNFLKALNKHVQVWKGFHFRFFIQEYISEEILLTKYKLTNLLKLLFVMQIVNCKCKVGDIELEM